MKYFKMFAGMCPEVPLHLVRFVELNFFGRALECPDFSGQAKTGDVAWVYVTFFSLLWL